MRSSAATGPTECASAMGMRSLPGIGTYGVGVAIEDSFSHQRPHRESHLRPDRLLGSHVYVTLLPVCLCYTRLPAFELPLLPSCFPHAVDTISMPAAQVSLRSWCPGCSYSQ